MIVERGLARIGGERLFEKIEALNLEGMVMKRKDSVYAFTRCRDWLKVRTSSGRTTLEKRIQKLEVIERLNVFKQPCRIDTPNKNH